MKKTRLEKEAVLLELYKQKFQTKDESIKAEITKQKEYYDDKIAGIYKANKPNGLKGFLYMLKHGFLSFIFSIVWTWKLTKLKFPRFTEFFVFFMVSNAVTVLQLILMPLFKYIFEQTSLINLTFQWGKVGSELDGSPYYIFNYMAGKISSGGGGGLGYFLAIQITLLIAQVINFFAQRNITFKSKSNPWKAAMWYAIAYVVITLVASAAQGLYKKPIYNLFMNTFNWGSTGEVVADVVTMIIYSAISFWVFYPIFKFIFKDKKEAKSN